MQPNLRALPPEILEPRRRKLGVADGVLDVAVSQVGLQGARVMPLVGQGKAAGVPEHVRVGLEGKPRLCACSLDQPANITSGTCVPVKDHSTDDATNQEADFCRRRTLPAFLCLVGVGSARCGSAVGNAAFPRLS